MISKDILRGSRLLIVCALLVAMFVEGADATRTRRASQEDSSPSPVELTNWRPLHTQHMQSNPQQLPRVFNKVPPGRDSQEANQRYSSGAKQPFVDNVQPVPHRYSHDQSNTDNRRNPMKNTLRIDNLYGNSDPKRSDKPVDDLQAKMSNLIAPLSSNSKLFKLPVVYKEVNEVPYGSSVVEQALGQGQPAADVYSFSQVVKLAQSNNKPAFIRVKSNLLDKQQFGFARLESVHKASDAPTDVFFGLGNPVQVQGKYSSAGFQSTFTDPVRKPTSGVMEHGPRSNGHNGMQSTRVDQPATLQRVSLPDPPQASGKERPSEQSKSPSHAVQALHSQSSYSPRGVKPGVGSVAAFGTMQLERYLDGSTDDKETSHVYGLRKLQNQPRAVPQLPSAVENTSKGKRSPMMFGFDKSDYRTKTDLDYPSVFKKYGFSQKGRIPSTAPPTPREMEMALTLNSKSDDTGAGKSDPFQGSFRLHSYGTHKSADIQPVPLLNGFQLKGKSDGTSVTMGSSNQGGKLSPRTTSAKNEGTVYRFDSRTYRKAKSKSSSSPSELSFSTTAGPRESSADLIPKIHRSTGFLDSQFGSIQSNTDTLTSPQKAATKMPDVQRSENSKARQKSEDSIVGNPHRFALDKHETSQKAYAPLGFKTSLKINGSMGPKTSELLYKSVSSSTDLPRAYGPHSTNVRPFNRFKTNSAMLAGNPSPIDDIQRLPVTYDHDENLKPSAAVVKGKRVKNRYFKGKNWKTNHGSTDGHTVDEQFSPLKFTGVKFTDVMGSASFSGISPADQMWSSSPTNHNTGTNSKSLSKPMKKVPHGHSSQFSGDWYGLQSVAGGIGHGQGVFRSMLTANSKSSSYRERQEGEVPNMAASVESMSLDHTNGHSSNGRSTKSEEVNFDVPEDLSELDYLNKLTRYSSFNSIQPRL